MKRKSAIFSLLIALVLVTTMALAACGEVEMATAIFAGGEGATGTQPAEVSVEVGSNITLPQNPYTKDGFDFVGWSDGANTYQAGATYALASNATFTAVWEARSYVLSYQGGEGATGSAPASHTEKAGTTITLKANTFEKEGFNFAGWLIGDTTYQAGSVYQTTASDKVAIAQWTVIPPTTYAVTYVGGAGATGIAPIEANKEAGATFTLAQNTFEKAGFVFKGWNDGTQTYQAGATYTMGANAVTFTAQWATAYTLTFDANGATGTNPQSITVEAGTTIQYPQNPYTMTGYEFLGWQLGAMTQLKVEGANLTVNANGTIKPVFGNKYTGDYGQMVLWANSTVAFVDGYEYQYTQSGNVVSISMDGYPYFSAELSGTTYTALDGMQDIVLTATDGTTLTFDGKGGAMLGTTSATYERVGDYEVYYELTVNSKVYKLVLDYDQDYNIIANVTIEGHVFGEGSQKHTVTFVGGKLSEFDVMTGTAPTVSDKTENEEFVLPENTFNYPGYTFAGWDDGNGGSFYEGYTYTMGDENVTFTALWSSNGNQWFINYVGGEGVTGDAPLQNIRPTGAIIILQSNTFTKAGYKFAGWNDGTSTYQPGDQYTIGTESVFFEAVWVEDAIFDGGKIIYIYHTGNNANGVSMDLSIQMYDDGIGYLSIYNSSSGAAIAEYAEFAYTNVDGVFTITSATAETGIASPINGTLQGNVLKIDLQHSYFGSTSTYSINTELFNLVVNDGTVDTIDMYMSNGSVIQPSVFVDDKSGYNLSWLVNDVAKTAEEVEIYSVTQDVKFVAVWTAKPTYTINYYDGVSATPFVQTTQDPDSYRLARNTVTNFAKEGYKFAGWTINTVEYGANASMTTALFEQYATDYVITVTARWTKQVNAFLTGLAGTDTNMTGTSLTVSENTKVWLPRASAPTSPFEENQNYFTKDGYTLSGWKCSADQVVYAPNTQYTMGSEDVTFEAIWLANDALNAFAGTYTNATGVTVDGETYVKFVFDGNSNVQLYYSNEAWSPQELEASATSATSFSATNNNGIKIDVTFDGDNAELVISFYNVLTGITSETDEAVFAKEGGSGSVEQNPYAGKVYGAGQIEYSAMAHITQITINSDGTASLDGHKPGNPAYGTEDTAFTTKVKDIRKKDGAENTYELDYAGDGYVEAVWTLVFGENQVTVTTESNEIDAVIFYESGFEPAPAPSIEAYYGTYVGELEFNNCTYTTVKIDANGATFTEEGYEDYPDTFALTPYMDGEIVKASFTVSNTESGTITFGNGTINVAVVKTGMLGYERNADFVVPVYYDVTFSLGENTAGTAPTAQSVLANTTATAPAEPKWTGYRFLGWFEEGSDVAFDFATPITASITLTARYEQITDVTVTFNLNAGADTTEPATIDAQEFAVGGVAVKPATDPTRAGYVFKGWQLDGVDYDFSSAVNDDITLTAKWVKLYTVTFDANGADGEVPQAVTVESGQTFTYPTNTFSMTGYEFLGWQLGTATALKVEGATLTVYSNYTVKPVFGNIYTGDDGEMSLWANSTVAFVDGTKYTYAKSGNAVTLSDSYGYEYAYEINGTTYVALDGMQAYSFTATDDTTLSFDGKGGAMLGETSGTYSIKYDEYGYYVEGVILTVNQTPYTLIFEQDGDNIVINAIIEGHVFGKGEKITLTATFTLGEGVTGTAPNAISNKGYADDGITFTLPDGTGLSKTGYTFAGWTIEGGDATVLTGSQTIKVDTTYVSAWTEDEVGGGEEGGDIDYSEATNQWAQYLTIDADGMIALTSADARTNFSGEVIIPSTVGGVAVKGFVGGGNSDSNLSPFFKNTTVTKVYLPEGMTTIAQGTFRTNTTTGSALQEVVLPSTITTIGNYAFAYCSALTTINIPTGVTSIGQNAFSYCAELAIDFVVPSGITVISSYVFQNCAKLKSVTLHDAITEINTSAFNGCTALANTEITLPAQLTKLGGSAFKGTGALTVYINSNLSTLSSTATVSANVFDTTATIYVAPEYWDAMQQSTSWTNYVTDSRFTQMPA